ncbi:MAG TPA: glycosyltransferase 87 family protein [Trebonia sp.]|nr:glycosyltransferase 87 family protein [Trebonia sp.]
MTRCYLSFAAFAAVLAVVSSQPIERCWGTWAAMGYLAAAAVIWCSRHRELLLPHVLALGFATIAPLAWQAWAGLPSRVGEGTLTVIAQAGARLLQQGTPYQHAAGLSRVLAYDPYEPLMAVFGLPHAIGVLGGWDAWAGDPRLWLTLTGAAGLYLAFRLADPSPSGHQARGAALRNTAFALASPVLSLEVATGGTDVPIIALLCMSLALTARDTPRAAAVTTGLACALKATAWPAVGVLAVTLAVTTTKARATRFTVLAALTTVAAMAAAAPAALGDPGSALRNTVLFPLGLTPHRTPAASPLPGHLLAAAGPAGRWAALALSGVAALTFTVWLTVRPPRDTRAAAVRLAVGLAAIFTLAPATRWGYFAYPLALAGWCYLTGPPRACPYSSERTVVTPAESPVSALGSASVGAAAAPDAAA